MAQLLPTAGNFVGIVTTHGKIERVLARLPGLLRLAVVGHEAKPILGDGLPRITSSDWIGSCIAPAIVCAQPRLVVLVWCRPREAFRMFRMISVRTDGTRFRSRRASLLWTYLAELGENNGRPSGDAARTS